MLSLDHPMILGVQQFSSFSEVDLYVMSQYFKPISYEKDTIILNIGEINDKMFLWKKESYKNFRIKKPTTLIPIG